MVDKKPTALMHLAVALRVLLVRAWTGHLLYMELLTEVVKLETELNRLLSRCSAQSHRLACIAQLALRHAVNVSLLGGPASSTWPRFERVEVSAALAAALLCAVRFEEVFEVSLESAEVAARLLNRERNRRERDRTTCDALKALLVDLDPSAARKALAEEVPQDDGTLASARETALAELLGALNTSAVLVTHGTLRAAIRPDERN